MYRLSMFIEGKEGIAAEPEKEEKLQTKAMHYYGISQNLKAILFTETLQVCEQVVLTREENGKMTLKKIVQSMKDPLTIEGNNVVC